MDLSTIDPSVIVARGKYSTLSGEYKTLMSTMQSWAQQACDDIRHGLNQHDVDSAQTMLGNAEKLCQQLWSSVAYALELKAQKDELWNEAWGKK